MIPLEIDIDMSKTLELTKTLGNYAVDHVAGGFSAVGVGIASVMLLIVLFYYFVSILDGGKFQTKMLVPLLIFFLVCNFGWIAKPVMYFTTTITESLVESCNSARTSICRSNDCEPSSTINDIYNATKGDKIPVKEGVEDRRLNNDTDVTQDDDAKKPTGEKARGWQKIIKKGTVGAANQLSEDFQKEAAGDPATVEKMDDSSFTWSSIISSVLSYICMIIAKVLCCLGGVMTAVILAFGPITFAFAIFPGQGGTVKSWFIRLCQFSLYAPIACLVDCFSLKIFDIIHNVTGLESVLLSIVVAACNLVCLTSVPTIASMIIEGAQGAISLSSGLQTLAHGLGMAAKTSDGMTTAVVGADRMQAVKDTLSGAKGAGLVGMYQDAKSGMGFGGMMSKYHTEGMNSRLHKK